MKKLTKKSIARSLAGSLSQSVLIISIFASSGCLFEKNGAVSPNGAKLGGGNSGAVSDSPEGSQPTIGNAELAKLVMGTGSREFAQINQTMARLTGINPSVGDARNTYLAVSASLPTTSSLMSLSGPHVVAITRLAAQYCNSAAATADANREAVYGLTAAEFGTLVTAVNFRAVADKAAKALLVRFTRETTPAAQDLAELNSLVADLLNPTAPSVRPNSLGVMISICTAALGSAKAIVAL